VGTRGTFLKWVDIIRTGPCFGRKFLIVFLLRRKHNVSIKYLALAVVASVAQLSAASIYSNLGPGQSYLNGGFFTSVGTNPLL